MLSFVQVLLKTRFITAINCTVECLWSRVCTTNWT